MKNQKQKEYETPETKKMEVFIEENICAGSRDKVVVDDDNTAVTIDEQEKGGDFTIDTWN